MLLPLSPLSAVSRLVLSSALQSISMASRPTRAGCPLHAVRSSAATQFCRLGLAVAAVNSLSARDLSTDTVRLVVLLWAEGQEGVVRGGSRQPTVVCLRR